MLDTATMPPISDTAFFCCGIREQDAHSRFPICNDVYAKDFMTEQGRIAYQKYQPGYFARGLNYARPRVIDNLITCRLRVNPELKVVLVGAGFDSRAYRLAGGDWLEIDEATIISHKNSCLPVDKCPNSLKRVTIDYAKDSLVDILNDNNSELDYLFIVEGVFMYLDVKEIETLLSALGAVKKRHTLICDLMTHSFINVFGRKSKKLFDEMGAVIKCQTDNPEDLFSEKDYKLLDEISVVESALRYGGIKWPIPFLPGKLKSGFRVMSFELV